MAAHHYEIVVDGVAGRVVRAVFDEFEIVVDGDRTRLRAELPDQAALFGALDRARALGLEIVALNRTTPGG